MRILVIEDEEKVARFIKKGLEAEDYDVDTAFDGESGERKARTHQYDAIILDILLPKKNGLEVVQALRTQGIKTPVLMLTARTATEDIVQGLDRGADDYLTKPFVFSEFLARVRSLVRRAAESTTTLTVGDLHLDALTRKAIRNEQSIALTAREFALLEYLMRRVGQVVTRQEIAKEIWGYDFDPGTNVVDVYINHLRKKIDSGTAHKYLRTMRGKGYIFTDIEGPSHTK